MPVYIISRSCTINMKMEMVTEEEFPGKNFKVAIRASAISKFAASLGWYSSQNKYFFLFGHSFAAATQL